MLTLTPVQGPFTGVKIVVCTPDKQNDPDTLRPTGQHLHHIYMHIKDVWTPFGRPAPDYSTRVVDQTPILGSKYVQGLKSVQNDIEQQGGHQTTRIGQQSE